MFWSKLLLLIVLHCRSVSPEETICPTPVRPSAVMSHFDYDASDSLEIILEVRWCASTSGRDMYFRNFLFEINNDPLEMTYFNSYDEYGQLPLECYLQLIYNPNNITTESVMIWNLPRTMLFFCDHLITECHVIWWNCSVLNRADHEDLIVHLLNGTFGPEDPTSNPTLLDRKDTKYRSMNAYISGTVIFGSWFYCFVVVLIAVVCGMLVYIYL